MDNRCKNRWLHWALTGAFFALFGCATSSPSDAPTTGDEPPSNLGKGDIYGTDSRQEVRTPSTPDAVLANADSVAMVLSAYTAISSDETHVWFSQATMSGRFELEHGVPLCDDERFADQIAPGFCTAFLIAPDLVATAGHCVNGHTRCHEMGFAFDFVRPENGPDPVKIPRENYYRCDSIVGRLYNAFEEPEAISNGEYWYDWAVLKLDRPVTDREPLGLSEGPYLPTGTQIYTLGHPSGIPMKYTQGQVASDDKDRFFNSTLDIYQGNSGSPVFDQTSHTVAGIVIRGSGGNSFEVVQTQLRLNEDGSAEIVNAPCGRSKHCDQIGDPGCIGNHVLRIDPVRIFTNPELQITEQHTLVEDDEAPGFSQRFEFSGIDGALDFVTVHLNAFAADANQVIVRLRKEDKTLNLIHRPRSLPYGRWSATSFDVASLDANGEWTIEVIDGGPEATTVEWAQVMLGYRPNTL